MHRFIPLSAKFFLLIPKVGKLAKDAIVVYTAQLADVYPLIVGFLAAGAVSAAFSTVSGLLVAGASAFSHDLYYRVINPNANEHTQMLMARIGTILMAAAVAIVALANLGLIAQLVAVAFSLAGCTIFPLFLLGIWWSGSNRTGRLGRPDSGFGGFCDCIDLFYSGKIRRYVTRDGVRHILSERMVFCNFWCTYRYPGEHCCLEIIKGRYAAGNQKIPGRKSPQL